MDIGLAEKTDLSSIKSAHSPKELISRHAVIIANLAPCTMRLSLSEGMVLTAGLDGKGLFILNSDNAAQASMRVKYRRNSVRLNSHMMYPHGTYIHYGQL